MQPHSNNPAQIVPAQCHNSCAPPAEPTADGKTEAGVAQTENHPFCLACACVVISSRRIFWMIPSLLSSPRTFQWLLWSSCHINGCSQLYLPSSCWLLAAELPREGSPPFYWQWPTSLQVILEAWRRVFALCPSLCPRLGGRKFRTGQLGCRFLTCFLHNFENNFIARCSRNRLNQTYSIKVLG